MVAKAFSRAAQLTHVNMVFQPTSNALLLNNSKTASVIRQSTTLPSAPQLARATSNREAPSMAPTWANPYPKSVPIWNRTSLLNAETGTTYFSMHHNQPNDMRAEKKPSSVLQAILFGIPDPDRYSFKREIMGKVARLSKIGGQTLEVKKSVVEMAHLLMEARTYHGTWIDELSNH